MCHSLCGHLFIVCVGRCAAVLMVSWVVVASGVLYYAYLTVDDLELATCNSLKLLQLQRDGDGNIELQNAAQEIPANSSAEPPSSQSTDTEERISAESAQLPSWCQAKCKRLKMQAAFVPIIVVLSAPLFLYTLSASIPHQNSLGIDVEMLRNFEYVAPLIFVLIESIILPELALKVEMIFREPEDQTKFGSTATDLQGYANLFLVSMQKMAVPVQR